MQSREDFQRISRHLAADIRALRDLLANGEYDIKCFTIGPVMERWENGPKYEAKIPDYLRGLDELKSAYEGDVTIIATKIAETIRHPWLMRSNVKSHDYRNGIWVKFADAIVSLSGRPSKKAAALLLDGDTMVAWDVNHLCYGIERLPWLYSKDIDGGRGIHLLCAEQNVVMKYLGLSAAMPGRQELGIIHQAIAEFKQRVVEEAITHPILGNYTLVSTHHPCSPCADIVAPNCDGRRVPTVGELVTKWDASFQAELTGPSRKTHEAVQHIRNAGIRVRCCNGLENLAA